MGVDSIGSQTSGSYGVPKNNRSAVTNEAQQYVAAEHNRKALGLIAVEEAIGTTVSPAVGSHELRINDDETAIAALEAVRDNDPPVLIAAGTIAGINEVGETLTFSPSTFFNATTRDRQWQKDTGSGFVDIGTEDGLTYVIVGIDAGASIRCHEDGINANGTTPANSNAITVKPFFNVAPTLVNDTTATFPAVQGDVLSVDISGLLGSTSETYQWLDTNGVAIPGADQATYTVDTGETGDGVSCLVTPSNAGGSSPATTAEEAVSVGWAPAGYSALFETVAPSSIALDTVPEPDEVIDWTDSTGNYTATAGTLAPSFPGSNLANGFEGVNFDGNGENLTTPIGVSSADEFAIFAVMRLSAAAFHNVIEFEDSSNVAQILLQITATGSVRLHRDGVSVFAGTPGSEMPSAAIARVMWAYSGGNAILRAESSPSETIAALAAGSHDAGGSIIGDRLGGSGGPFNGQLYVLPIYGGASGVPGSAMERQAVWDALGARFGL